MTTASSHFSVWICALVLAWNHSGSAVEPDWGRARTDLISTLSALIKLDTVNPPGNETRAAEYLQRLLAGDGIPSDIYTRTTARGNLVARIKGNGRKKPLLLMGHTDVVGVERSKWTVDPFAAVIKDGYLYGRGALDDKGMTAACVEVMRWVHRLKLNLDRDIILLAEAAEESTPVDGIDFMVEKHWDKIDCEFALNEGGGIRMTNGRVHYVGVATTEKVPRAVLISSKGSSGHGSRPRLDNAIVKLCKAVATIGEWQPPMRLNDTTRQFFQRLATVSPPEEAFLYANLENPAVSDMIQKKLRAENIGYNSMLRTSISPNMVRGGFRVNVIPADGLATLDVRWLPDEDVGAFVETLRRLVNDPAIDITLAEEGSRKPAAPSRLDNAMWAAIETAQSKVFPGSITLPMMLTGATDSAQLRERGVQAYGIGPMVSEEDTLTVHGNDERVHIEGLGKFLQFLWATVMTVSGS